MSIKVIDLYPAKSEVVDVEVFAVDQVSPWTLEIDRGAIHSEEMPKAIHVRGTGHVFHLWGKGDAPGATVYADAQHALRLVVTDKMLDPLYA